VGSGEGVARWRRGYEELPKGETSTILVSEMIKLPSDRDPPQTRIAQIAEHRGSDIDVASS
jgi:hypothetical protein